MYTYYSLTFASSEMMQVFHNKCIFLGRNWISVYDILSNMMSESIHIYSRLLTNYIVGKNAEKKNPPRIGVVGR